MDSKQRDAKIDKVYDQMQTITRRANARSRQLAEPLSFVEHSLLRFIATTAGARATDIAESFSLNRSTVSRQVSTLVDLGLVNYCDNETGRGKILIITELGSKQLAQSAAVHRVVVAERLTDWSEDDIAIFASLLGRYSEAENQ